MLRLFPVILAGLLVVTVAVVDARQAQQTVVLTLQAPAPLDAKVLH